MIPTLHTARLTLRPFRAEDTEAFLAFYASPRSKGVGGPLPRHTAWRGHAAVIGHWTLRGYGMFAVEETATGRLAGRVGPYFPADWPEPEIGWTVLDHAEGRGIAFEAASATRDWAYSTLGWTTAISLIAQDNARSQALAKRLGCTRDGDFTHPDWGAMQVWRHPGPEARR